MNDDNYDPTTNSIQFSEPFRYPDDNMDTSNSTADNIRILQFLNKLANYLIPANNPRLTLCALLYASNMDLSYILQCANTEVAIATKLGVSKQSFCTVLKQVRHDFGLVHSTTINHGVTKETYKNNAKKLRL